MAYSLPSASGSLVTAATVKTHLCALIAAEDKDHPLSDLALASALRRQGWAIARRTVAKYRDELGIPPCHQRRAAPESVQALARSS
jgi:RNA polymerase sigma-54 factor